MRVGDTLKVAFWGVAIVFFGFLGIFLISLFGNITVTNQQDYTLLKKSVEAAMYDSIDEIAYRNGFCVCTNQSKKNGKYSFDNKSQYQLYSLENNECKVSGFTFCKKLNGEFKIKEEVFVESFLRRFAENSKGNKYYKVIVQDVIEYPPKVSVEVRTYENYGLEDSTIATFSESDFKISNKIDSILEYK